MNRLLRVMHVPAAAIGLLPIFLVLLVTGLWLWSAWSDGNGAISDELARFDRVRSLAAYKQVLGTLDAGAEDKIYGDLFLKGGTGAVISADLLNGLKQMAAAKDIEVVQAGDLQPKKEGPITLVGGSLEMSGTITGIYDLIRQIEAAKPLLFIDRLNLRASPPPGPEEKNDTQLTIEINVYGAVRSSQLLPAGKSS